MSNWSLGGTAGGGPEAPEDGAAPAAGRGFFHRLGRVELRFVQLCVVLMTLLVLTSAVSRTVGRPVSWAVDLATFSFAWAVFVGADLALRNGKMVSIDLLIDRFPERVRTWVQLANSVMVVVFLIAMVVLGSMLSSSTYERTFSGLPWLSYTWVTVSVPLGCLLMLYTMTHRIRELVRELTGAPR